MATNNPERDRAMNQESTGTIYHVREHLARGGGMLYRTHERQYWSHDLYALAQEQGPGTVIWRHRSHLGAGDIRETWTGERWEDEPLLGEAH